MAAQSDDSDTEMHRDGRSSSLTSAFGWPEGVVAWSLEDIKFRAEEHRLCVAGYVQVAYIPPRMCDTACWQSKSLSAVLIIDLAWPESQLHPCATVPGVLHPLSQVHNWQLLPCDAPSLLYPVKVKQRIAATYSLHLEVYAARDIVISVGFKHGTHTVGVYLVQSTTDTAWSQLSNGTHIFTCT